MNTDYCDFSTVELTAGGTASLQLPDAMFLHFIGSEAKRFMLAIDGEQAVPCWGGWNLRIDQGKMQRLTLRSMPGETQDLTISLFHGRGKFDLSGITLAEHFFSQRPLERRLPTNIFPIRHMSPAGDHPRILMRRELFSFSGEMSSLEGVISPGSTLFDSFGIAHDADQQASVSYRFAEHGPDYPIKPGPFFTGRTSGPLRLKIDQLRPWGQFPSFWINAWRSNAAFVQPTLLEDTVRFVTNDGSSMGDAVDLVWRINGQRGGVGMHGLGDRGFRQIWNPWGMGEQQSLMRIQEFYEQASGEPLKVELFVNINLNSVEHEELTTLDLEMNFRTWRGGRWFMNDGSTLLEEGNFTHSGATQMQYHNKRFVRENARGQTFKAMEYNFNPSLGAGTFTWF